VPWLESLSGDRRQDRIWLFIGVRDAYERGREAAVNEKVEPPTLHECRHGYAALMIAAGVNIKALSTFMGHANIASTTSVAVSAAMGLLYDKHSFSL
jgi:integrase